MRIIKKNSVNETDAESVILDSTLFSSGQMVEGVAYCKYFKEAITESGKNYVKLYLGDKGFRTFQANIMNINKKTTTTEMMNDWVGKAVVIKGEVSHFMGMNIVHILQMDKVAEGVYKETDFIPQINDLENQIVKFKHHLESIISEDMLHTVKAIKNISVVEGLSRAYTRKDEGKLGDGLIICNELVSALNTMYEEEDRLERDLYASLTIVSTGIMLAVNTKSSKEIKGMDNTMMENYIKSIDLAKRNAVFNPTVEERCMEEFKHLYSVMYLDVEPKTFLAKFYKNTFESVVNNLAIVRMESSTRRGNTNLFGDVEHTRI